MCRLLLFLCLTCLPTALWAQKAPRPDINLDEFIQALFPQPEDDVNYEKVYETLFLLYTNPLDLNKATREDLQALYILSELQINNFLAYRKENGTLITLYELQAVPLFDLETIYKILPFVTVDDSKLISSRPLWERITREADSHYLLIRYARTLEEQKGYTDRATASSRYLGSPDRLYMRYRISQSNDYSIGFTLEKDAGEQLIFDRKSYRQGADFSSYHAHFRNLGKLKTLALGDFQAQFGQGLVYSAGLTVGKGAETVQTLRRSNLGLLPYTSSLESGFFRGVGATYQVGKFEVTAIFSRLRRDGSFSETLDSLGLENSDENVFIETLRTTGMHRTASEIAGKGIFLETSVGANILYAPEKSPLQVGLSYLHTGYNLPFQRGFRSEKDSLRFLYEFAGKSNGILGLSANYQWQNFSFFSEVARSSSGGVGGLGGVIASLSPAVDMSFLYRHYARDFHTFYGSAFSENTRNINESGFYWGLKITPNRKWKFAAYFDRFSFPWIRYRVDRPSDGYEYLTRITHQVSRKISLYAQIRHEIKDRNLSSDFITTNMGEVASTVRKNYLLNLDYKAEEIFTLRSRLQYSTFQIGGKRTSGIAVVQDIGVKIKKWEFEARYAIFGTDDFDNRQYVYEQDVLWAFSFPAYNGQGTRKYLLIRYAPFKRVDIWLRYARFDFREQENISSAGEEIRGNTRSEIKLQVRLKFK